MTPAPAEDSRKDTTLMDESITISQILDTQEAQQETIDKLMRTVTEQAGSIADLQKKVDNLEALKG